MDLLKRDCDEGRKPLISVENIEFWSDENSHPFDSYEAALAHFEQSAPVIFTKCDFR